MKRIIFLSALISFILFTFSQAQDNCYELVWNDEFNYTGLPDSTKWTYETGGEGWGNNELQYYTANRPENARVEDGNLIIEARKENYENRSYTSARLITYPNNHSWKYGKIEARMKLPYGQGIWPAFWMLGDRFFEGAGWPACGEIDIMEMIGGNGRENTVHGTIHWEDANNNHASYGGHKTLSAGTYADTFHVFSIEWNEQSIRWFLDGVQYHVVDITPAALSEFHNNFFLILNLAVGGNWPGNPNSTTEFPQQLTVDYVRVYQKNESPKIIGPASVTKSQEGIHFTTVESDDFTYTWKVPDGAEISNGQGTHAATVNWGCEADTITCEVITVCDTHILSLPVSLESISLQGKSLVEAGEENLKYTLPKMVNTDYIWYSSINGSLIHADTNVFEVTWGNEDGYIKAWFENACGIDSIQKNIYLARQLPYPDPNSPNAIPGTIEAVNFDSGGEGISYHDTDAINEGPGPRQDEAVDTETYDGSSNVGWTHPGEWLEYTIEVAHDTLYTLQAHVASQFNTGRFSLLVNGEDRTGQIAVPSTGSWSSFNPILIEDIRLHTSDTMLRVSIVQGDFNLRNMTFEISSPSTTDVVHLKHNEIIVYPTLVNDQINVLNHRYAKKYFIINTSGTILKSGMMHDSSISMSELKKGMYILFLELADGRHATKFIKK